MAWNVLKNLCCLCFMVAIACAVDSLNFSKSALPEENLERQVFSSVESNEEKENNAIPESLLIQMKDIRNVSQFLRHFVLPEQNASDSGMFDIQGSAQFGNQTSSRRGLSAAATPHVAQFAGCQPENQVVKLEDPQDNGVFIWPPCVRLRRCGGCCTSNMLTCRPVKTSQIIITVLQVRYNGPQSNAFRNDGTKFLSMEQHDRCSCDCKEQAEHCTEQQEYRANECRCVCPNQDEAEACNEPNRIWDSRECVCLCRTNKECSTGFYFNIGSCRCEALRVSLISRWRFMLHDEEGNSTKEALNLLESHHRMNS